MEFGHRQSIKEIVCLLEMLRMLTPTAHHYINTNKGIRHHLFYIVHLMGEEGSVVASVHKFQNGVRTALKRYVKMGHESPAVRAIIDKLIREQVRLDTRDSITLNSLYAVEGFYEVDECLMGRLSEITDIYSCDDNLLSAFCSGLTGLIDEGADGRVTRQSAGVGDGTVSTEVAASVLNLQKIARAVAPCARRLERPNHSNGLLGIVRLTCKNILYLSPVTENLRIQGLLLHRVNDSLDKIDLLVGAEDEAHTRHRSNLLGLELSVASGDNDKGTGVLTYHSMDYLTALVIGLTRDRAGINETDVGFFTLSGIGDAEVHQATSERTRLREVEFASECIIASGLTA